MKENIRELLDEMIATASVKPFWQRKHLAEVKNNIKDNAEYLMPITWLMAGVKRVALGTEDIKLSEHTHENHHDWYDVIFNYCPLLKEIFKNDLDGVTWSDKITEQEKAEIISHINENFKLQMRIRRKK